LGIFSGLGASTLMASLIGSILCKPKFDFFFFEKSTCTGAWLIPRIELRSGSVLEPLMMESVDLTLSLEIKVFLLIA
jgi:hypothetical protein